MICRKCKTKYDGNFCPTCGTSAKKSITWVVFSCVLTLFFFFSFFVFFPSIRSILCLASAVLMFPLPSWQNIIQNKLGIKKWIKPTTVCVLFFLSIMIVPSNMQPPNSLPVAAGSSDVSATQLEDSTPKASIIDGSVISSSSLPQSTASSKSEVSDSSSKVSSAASNPVSSAGASSAASKSPAVVTPSSAPQQVVPSSSAEQNKIDDEPIQNEGITVYITRTGKKYHYSGSCNGGTYFESTLEEALKKGLKPCEKCVN